MKKLLGGLLFRQRIRQSHGPSHTVTIFFKVVADLFQISLCLNCDNAAQTSTSFKTCQAAVRGACVCRAELAIDVEG